MEHGDMKKISKYVVGPLIGALFLYLTLRQVDFANCWIYIRQAKLFWVAVAVVVYSLAFFVRSVRWRYLMAPLKDVPRPQLFNYLIIGFFMNNLLPLRLGELVRAHITGQKAGTTRSGVLATVVIERLFDGLSYVVLFFLTFLVLPFPAWTKKSMGAGSILFVGVLFILFLLSKNQSLAERVFAAMPLPRAIRERVNAAFSNFLRGLKSLGNASSLIKVLLLSIVVWTIEGLVFYVMGLSFGMQLTVFQGILVMIIIGMGAILPTAPGYVGTVEFLGTASLVFLGINKNLAFGYIITLHLLQLLTVTFWGLRSLMVEKITLSELIRIEKQEQN
jgi:uncharacterized protein (TIRG00374 family)